MGRRNTIEYVIRLLSGDEAGTTNTKMLGCFSRYERAKRSAARLTAPEQLFVVDYFIAARKRLQSSPVVSSCDCAACRRERRRAERRCGCFACQTANRANGERLAA